VPEEHAVTSETDTGAAEAGHLTPPDVEGVWRRWEPRFIAAGADFNIIARLRTAISSWSEWSRAWSAEADELSLAAEEAFGLGRTLTAGGLWSQASLLHHFGGMYYISDLQQFHDAHRKSVELYRRAAPLLQPPAERITGTLAGSEYVGYLQVPASERPPPVVMMFNGFEGTKEESQNRVAELHARGLATLSWDGPGRGEAWHHTPMTGDYGPAAGAMIDALEQVPGVDATRIGALGPNRGGFVAAKAAAQEPRIRALATTSPGYDRRETDWNSAYQEAFFVHIFRLDSAADLASRITERDLTLEGEAERIRCPTLIVAGDRDQGTHFEGSKRLYAEVQGEKSWVVVKNSERNGNNVPYLIRPLMADFLAEHLLG
jgi:2,6-dihydroxypseudooxynicotine hydrolase